MSHVLKPGVPVKAFFQEVVRGDIDKFYKKSNTTKSGGGARDLRMSPNDIFWPELAVFFPNEISDRQRSGRIISQVIGNSSENQESIIKFMGPTNQRPRECRICEIYLISNWMITYQEFAEAQSNQLLLFYLLTLDSRDVVWASKFRSDAISKFAPKVRTTIEEIITNSGRKTVRGIINF